MKAWRFLPDSFQFIIHQSSYHLVLHTYSVILTMLYNNLQITANGKEMKFIREN